MRNFASSQSIVRYDCVSANKLLQTCVKGGDLDLKIQARKASGKPFELSLILDWFVQLTNAVRYIHERCSTIFNTIDLSWCLTRRILHRDLKTRYSAMLLIMLNLF